jgi:hypothetical protein
MLLNGKFNTRVRNFVHYLEIGIHCLKIFNFELPFQVKRPRSGPVHTKFKDRDPWGGGGGVVKRSTDPA